MVHVSIKSWNSGTTFFLEIAVHLYGMKSWNRLKYAFLKRLKIIQIMVSEYKYNLIHWKGKRMMYVHTPYKNQWAPTKKAAGTGQQILYVIHPTMQAYYLSSQDIILDLRTLRHGGPKVQYSTKKEKKC